MADIVLRSPLADVLRIERSSSLPDAAGVLLSEQAMLGHITLRYAGPSADLDRPLNLSLPQHAGGVSQNKADGLTAFWRGPDEWLLLTRDSTVLCQRLRQTLAGRQAALVDLSSGQTVIVVGGPRARLVLTKGCSIDLHPQTLPPGVCCQTLLAQTSVLVWHTPGGDYRLVVRRSFAPYLWRWLEDAAEEYGCAIIGCEPSLSVKN